MQIRIASCILLWTASCISLSMASRILRTTSYVEDGCRLLLILLRVASCMHANTHSLLHITADGLMHVADGNLMG
jgi:hypothetical protein